MTKKELIEALQADKSPEDQEVFAKTTDDDLWSISEVSFERGAIVLVESTQEEWPEEDEDEYGREYDDE